MIILKFKAGRQTQSNITEFTVANLNHSPFQIIVQYC